jgi:HEPN domain-containing protein
MKATKAMKRALDEGRQDDAIFASQLVEEGLRALLQGQPTGAETSPPPVTEGV